MSSLNVRLAAKVLREVAASDLNLPSLRQRFGDWVARSPAVIRVCRTPQGDEDVLAFLRAALKSQPHLRPTPLLRSLRDQGFACEYRRFVNLFQQVRESGHVH